MSEGWYYAKGDNTVGPVSLDNLRSALSRQREAALVLVWQEGFADWMEARSVPELARVVAGPPPLPVRSVAEPVVPERRLSPLSPEYRQNVSDDKKPRNWMGTISGWAVVVVSIGLSKVFGGAYWMPVLLIALSIWIFIKLKLREYAAWMLGVLVGHMLWMTVGHATLLQSQSSSSSVAQAGIRNRTGSWGRKASPGVTAGTQCNRPGFGRKGARVGLHPVPRFNGGMPAPTLPERSRHGWMSARRSRADRGCVCHDLSAALGSGRGPNRRSLVQR